MVRFVVLSSVLLGVLAWFVSGTAPADVSRHITFQGRLADPDTGKPKPDGVYTMTWMIYDAPQGGTLLFTEVDDVTVEGGIFNAVLGDQEWNPLTLDFSDDYWLGVKVGTDAEMADRIPFEASPYALFALDIPDGSVVTPKIADGAVTGSKLASKFGPSQRELLNFVPRLEAGGPDYVLTNLPPNYPGWTTLDLTTCGVPASAKAVLLDVTLEDGDSPAPLYLSPESMNHNWRTHVVGSDFAGGRQESEQKIVQCKNGQVVYSVNEGEYGDGYIAYLSFTVQGWWEPAKTN